MEGSRPSTDFLGPLFVMLEIMGASCVSTPVFTSLSSSLCFIVLSKVFCKCSSQTCAVLRETRTGFLLLVPGGEGSEIYSNKIRMTFFLEDSYILKKNVG